MANTCHTGSETNPLKIWRKVDPSCSYSDSTDVEYPNEWVDQAVGREVTRGIKLRECKPHSRLKPDYYGVNIDCVTLRGCDEIEHKRGSTSKRFNKAKTYMGPVSYLTWTHQEDIPSQGCRAGTSYSRCLSSKGAKTQRPKRCPMRIAELAVPTKRHCLETWRNNCNILPGYMVERLQQQVLDQKPVVQISDAVNSFKIRNRSKVRAYNKMSAKPSACMTETKQLSSIFCFKMAKQLNVPANITLNPELEKISQVVAYDMSRINDNRRRTNRRKQPIINAANKRIEIEMSKKVAVWIANILEDTTYKLLEDDLRDLEEEEGPVLDFIDDVVDTVMGICEPIASNILSENPSEVTSIDNFERYQQALENIHSVIATPLIENLHSYVKETHDFQNENNLPNKNPKDKKVDSVASLSKKVDTSDHDSGVNAVINNIINELNSNINKVITTSSIVDLNGIPKENHDVQIENEDMNPNFKDDNVDPVASSAKQNETSALKSVQIAPENNILNESDNSYEVTVTPKLVDLHSYVKENYDVQNEDDEPNANIDDNDVDITSNQISSDIDVSNNKGILDETPIQIIDNLNAEKVSKESNVFDIDSEDYSYINNKNKVENFSKIDLATGIESAGLPQNQAPDKHDDNIRNEQRKVPSNLSADNVRPNIVFAPPNDHLLSDADEPWPADIRTPTVKPSANVNKSITSMGKILERDEKEDILSQDEQEISITDISEKRASIGYGHIYNDKQYTVQPKKDAIASEKTTIEDGLTKDDSDRLILTNHSYIYETSKSNVTVVESAEKILKPTSVKLYLMKSTVDNIPTKQSATEYVSSTSTADGHKPYIQENKLDPEQAERKTHHVAPKSKIDYRVNHNTAPSWVTTDIGKGEPSEDSFPRYIVNRQSENKKNDIRIWITNLENISANLEMWNNWLNCACRNITNLKAKTETNKLLAPCVTARDTREWLRLKGDIATDALLWTKFHKRAQTKLISYKHIYGRDIKVKPKKYYQKCLCRHNYKTKRT